MINQNNSKSFISVNRSLSNKKVKEFAQLDTRIIQRRKQDYKLKLYDEEENQNVCYSEESSFDEKFDYNIKNPNDLVEEIYQLKKTELDLISQNNNDKILPLVNINQKSEQFLQEPLSHKLYRQTSINKIHLTQNDDSILSDNSIQIQKHTLTQRNLKSNNKYTDLLKTKTQAKVKCQIKKIEKPKDSENDEKLPQIWQQYYNILPNKDKLKIKQSFLELNKQFKEMEKEKVLEPFLKDQKLKVKLMNPLIIRKDKPYFVAENKDNKNLIDNMKNENTNLNKDEYLVVNYDKIMDYI